jgi:hypothetical protein
VFPTSVPVWIRDSCLADVMKKANDLAAKKKILLQHFEFPPQKFDLFD